MSEEAVTKRSRKSPVYSLEKIVELTAEASELLKEKFVIIEVKTGFISPEKALEFAGKWKVEGTLRVVRKATDLFEGAVTMPEPIYSLKKMTWEPEKKVRKTRKPRVAKASGADSCPLPEDNPDSIPSVEDEGLNPEPEGVE